MPSAPVVTGIPTFGRLPDAVTVCITTVPGSTAPLGPSKERLPPPPRRRHHRPVTPDQRAPRHGGAAPPRGQPAAAQRHKTAAAGGAPAPAQPRSAAGSRLPPAGGAPAPRQPAAAHGQPPAAAGLHRGLGRRPLGPQPVPHALRRACAAGRVPLRRLAPLRRCRVGRQPLRAAPHAGRRCRFPAQLSQSERPLQLGGGRREGPPGGGGGGDDAAVAERAQGPSIPAQALPATQAGEVALRAALQHHIACFVCHGATRRSHLGSARMARRTSLCTSRSTSVGAAALF